MARILETLEIGTAVYCGDERVGAVRGLYAEGTARAVEWLAVEWDGRGLLALPATEVDSIDERGVHLLQSNSHAYDELIDFSEARFPTVHKLA